MLIVCVVLTAIKKPWGVVGRKEGWVDGKAGLRIAYSNQKFEGPLCPSPRGRPWYG